MNDLQRLADVLIYQAIHVQEAWERLTKMIDTEIDNNSLPYDEFENSDKYNFLYEVLRNGVVALGKLESQIKEQTHAFKFMERTVLKVLNEGDNGGDEAEDNE